MVLMWMMWGSPSARVFHLNQTNRQGQLMNAKQMFLQRIICDCAVTAGLLCSRNLLVEALFIGHLFFPVLYEQGMVFLKHLDCWNIMKTTKLIKLYEVQI